MKEFKPVVYDAAKVNKELAEFDRLLRSRPSLSERKDLMPFFKKREHLSAFLGTYAFTLGPGTHLAYEFPHFPLT